MLGIILAGGSGSRLYPCTQFISKHLLPVAGKPMIFYPITTLIYLGCTEIVIICTPRDKILFERVFHIIRKLNVQLHIVEQEEPEGIPHAILRTRNIRRGREALVILGDNIIVGNDFKKMQIAQDIGSLSIVTKKVSNPSDYGVVLDGPDGRTFVEKPQGLDFGNAVIGLYKIPGDVDDKIMKQEYSHRNELEIIDTISMYNDEDRLSQYYLGRATYWCDAGTYARITEADQVVAVLEKNAQGLLGSPEEAALNSKLISEKEFVDLISEMPNCPYRNSLKSLV